MEASNLKSRANDFQCGARLVSECGLGGQHLPNSAPPFGTLSETRYRWRPVKYTFTILHQRAASCSPEGGVICQVMLPCDEDEDTEPESV